MAKITMRHIKGMRFIGETEDHSIILESDYLNEQKAPAPLEVFLMSLGGCTGMDVIAILQKMRAEPRKFEIYIEGERAEEHPKVYTKVKIKYHFEGTEYEKAKKAVELSQNKYCPVSAMLRRSGCIIDYEIEVRE